MRTPARRSRERGIATLEVVLSMPLLLAALMAIVQLGLIAHAQSIARAAADEGAAQARTYNGTAAQGQSRADDYVNRLAGGTLRDRQVNATRTAQTASVTVSGRVVSLIPGWHPHIRQTSTGPVERFIEEAP